MVGVARGVLVLASVVLDASKNELWLLAFAEAGIDNDEFGLCVGKPNNVGGGSSRRAIWKSCS